MNAGSFNFYNCFFAYLDVESNTTTIFICRTTQVHTVFLKLFTLIML